MSSKLPTHTCVVGLQTDGAVHCAFDVQASAFRAERRAPTMASVEAMRSASVRRRKKGIKAVYGIADALDKSRGG